ncbi:protein kinase [Nocardia amamiensis]|uniref:non-specific serine/threonine protein kinase n=1 Tax=Nocardia amamiensis TaxID=404578 RepID=A0ABS0CVE7_9NOCA|nr:protein kinase [Nocardia amamiensis]MBF6298814.1 protein kinase [Nocardia amamiensis]
MQPLGASDPTRIGDYRLLGVLGAGGMGRVYLGRNAGGRTLAVKVIRPDMIDAEFRERFRREVTAARRVGGRFTAPVLDADVDADPPWLATGYVAGFALADAVDTYGPFTENSLLVLAHGLVEALMAVHQAGVVHRDLKPSNVLLALDGPKVIDFGIARAIDDSKLTTTGKVIGSPGFMCPEQVTGDPIGPPADIFALGGVLVFAATGHGPFGIGETLQMLWRVVYEQPQLDDVPERLRPLVAACLTKDAAARPTLDQLLTRLTELGIPDRGGWLPGPLLEQVSRRAIELLDLDSGTIDRLEPTTLGQLDRLESSTPASLDRPQSSTRGPADQPQSPTPSSIDRPQFPPPTPGDRPHAPTPGSIDRPQSPTLTTGDRPHSPAPGSIDRPDRTTPGSADPARTADTIARPTTPPPHTRSGNAEHSAPTQTWQPGPHPSPAFGHPAAGQPTYSPAHQHSPQFASAQASTLRRAILIAGALAVAVAVAVAAFAVGAKLRGSDSTAATAAPSPEVVTTTTAARTLAGSPVTTVPQAFVGEWRGVARDALATFDIVLIIRDGAVGEEVAQSSNTGKLSGERCERAERLTGATETQIAFVARLSGGSAGCFDNGSASTVTLRPDGSLSYSTSGGVGNIEGVLRRS